MENVKDKVAVITGAAGGIGLGAAKAFARAGMRIVLVDIDEVRLIHAVNSLRELGAEVIGFEFDVRLPTAWKELKKQTLSKYGAIHLICSNAGGPIPRAVKNVDQADWSRVLDLNLFASIYGVQTFLPLFEKQGEGHFNVTSSMSGHIPFPPVVTYNVAKAGLNAYMETLAHELRQERSPVEVSVFCPGEVTTKGVENAMSLARAEGYKPTTEELNIVRSATTGLTRSGISPDKAGQILLEGIQAGKFWIFSHPNWVDGPLKRRHEAMIENGELVRL